MSENYLWFLVVLLGPVLLGGAILDAAAASQQGRTVRE